MTPLARDANDAVAVVGESVPSWVSAVNATAFAGVDAEKLEAFLVRFFVYVVMNAVCCLKRVSSRFFASTATQQSVCSAASCFALVVSVAGSGN